MSPGCLDALISHLGNALLAKTEFQPLVKKSQQSFSEFTTESFKEYYSAFLSLLPQTGNYFKVPGTTNLTVPHPSHQAAWKAKEKTFASLSAPPVVS